MLSVEYKNPYTLKLYEKNARTHSKEQVAQIVASIREFGWTNPILLDETDEIIAGHGRLMAALEMGSKKVPTITLEGLTDEQKRAYTIADNQLALNAGWDLEVLTEEVQRLVDEDFDIDLLGFDELEMHDLLFGPHRNEGSNQLQETFGAPPFSVLDARQGYWSQRKKQWMELGLASEKGRAEKLLSLSPLMGKAATRDSTSVFDPVLAEICVRWFSPKGGLVLDPFAGGSVRGIVSVLCGRQYIGNDLRAEQIDENNRQADAICGDIKPEWTIGDSADIDSIVGNIEADMVLTCPPYADLEVYSDLPGELSAMPYREFMNRYAGIIQKTYDLMRDNTFAVFVVGELRAKRGGAYRGFVPDTIDACCAAGFSYYNEIIYVTKLGSLPLRAGKMMAKSRKIGKTHQNVLVFVKGNAGKAVERCGDIMSFLQLSDDGFEDEQAA